MNTRQHFDPREMTANTIGRDLLSALVAELKLLPQPWVKLSQSKQDDIIDRLRDRVDANIKMAVHLIASEGRTVVQGDLDQVTIKDGAKVVLIVVADSQPHTGGMGQVRGEADQRAMNLGKEYTDLDGDGMDDQSNVVDAEFRELPPPAAPAGPTDAQLEQARVDGYNAAAQGQPESDCPVMDGQLCIQWVKGWKQWHEEQDPQAEE